MDLKRAYEIFKKGWGTDTSWDPHSWDEDRPSDGQCYVTARLVQHFWKGDIVRYIRRSDDINHYWNRLPDGREVDLTADQLDCDDFLPPEEFREGARVVGPYKSMNDRVKRLLRRVGDELGQLSGEPPLAPAPGRSKGSGTVKCRKPESSEITSLVVRMPDGKRKGSVVASSKRNIK